jgi:uncharacterized protein YeaO (DUF488 family)
VTVEVVRVYDIGSGDGRLKILVDRLWPRGVRKETAPVDLWLKAVAPSTGLRKWYGHQPERFDEFAERYRQELQQPPARDALRELCRHTEAGDVALVTATKDVERSGACVLRGVLLGKREAEP